MLSIEALIEIHSGNDVAPIKQSSNTITLSEKCAMNPAVLTPRYLKMFTNSRKMALISSNSVWVCSICRYFKATNMCSSIVAQPNDSCLIVMEKCYLTCGQGRCIDAARSLRNKDAKSRKNSGMGFRLAFRSAIELMVEPRELESRDEVECEREK